MASAHKCGGYILSSHFSFRTSPYFNNNIMKHLVLFAAFWAALLSCVNAQTPMYQADFKCSLYHCNVVIAPAEQLAACYDYNFESVGTAILSYTGDGDFVTVDNETGHVTRFEHIAGDTYMMHQDVFGVDVTAVGTFVPATVTD